MSQIKEKAFGKRVFERAMPDVDTLATRVTELSRELAINRIQVKQFKFLLDRLRGRLEGLSMQADGDAKDALNGLIGWLGDEERAALEPDYPNPRAVRDNLLRVMAAHVTVLPSGQVAHEGEEHQLLLFHV